MGHIESQYDVEKRFQVSGKLGDKRRDQVVQVLLVDVPEVKIKVAHRRLSQLAHGLDILYDRGTDG